jgi:hypothetical protein
LRYGQWTELWKSRRIPFSKRKGEMLVVIGKNLGCLDAQNSAHLPSAWNTLYYLARLDRSLLENLILDGIIHPGLTLTEAKQLMAQSKGASEGRKPTLRQRFKKFEACLRTHSDNWTDNERAWIRRELLHLADELCVASQLKRRARVSPACKPTSERRHRAGEDKIVEKRPTKPQSSQELSPAHAPMQASTLYEK